MIDITGLDKADVLAALYNASRPLGMGFVRYAPEPMSRAEAGEYLAKGHYFDYLKGRVMKLSLKGDTSFEEGLYDRDNGTGAAARVIAILREKTGCVNPPEIRQAHQDGKLEAAASVKTRLHEESKHEGNVFTLGLADVAEPLGNAVDKALDGTTRSV